MGTIMVIAVMLLLVIVVGQEQLMKRSGSILVNCHYKGMTKSHTVAEPLLGIHDRLLLCFNLQCGSGISEHAA